MEWCRFVGCVPVSQVSHQDLVALRFTEKHTIDCMICCSPTRRNYGYKWASKARKAWSASRAPFKERIEAPWGHKTAPSGTFWGRGSNEFRNVTIEVVTFRIQAVKVPKFGAIWSQFGAIGSTLAHRGDTPWSHQAHFAAAEATKFETLR